MGTLFALLFLTAAIDGTVTFVKVLRKNARKGRARDLPSAARPPVSPRVTAPAPSLGRATPSRDASPELTAEVHARVHEQARETPPAPHAEVPDHLPVTVKPWSFSRSEPSTLS
ncbi:hypothetical protein [Deinococcus planocerae]|uniref:hypothetical protein n=1 Tax=Deinococcus planocerae TaxID=1737569 RepID=UPI000C7F635C|nr:hypothetical protein [Deinococcus planocerae]